MTRVHRQLSLDFELHPDLRRRQQEEPERAPLIEGTITGKLEVPCPVDLNAGDELTVTVAGADGQVLSRAKLEVDYAYPKPIRIKDVGVVGTERVHKVKVTEVL